MATTKGALEKSIFFQKLVLKESKDPKQKERARKAIEKLQTELDNMITRASNPTKRKFSPAQLAAQKLFAERARAGKLKKNPGLYANINAKKKRIAAGSGEKMRKPGQAGRPTAQAFIDSAKTAKRNPDKAKPRAYVRRVSQATGTAPSKRLIARRKIALTAPAGYFPNPKTSAMMTGYQVICMHPKKHVVGVFKTMAQAKQIAVAMANLNNVTYAVKTVKVHKTHFAV